MPSGATASEDPRRTGHTRDVVGRAANQKGVAVGGERDSGALEYSAGDRGVGTGADEFAALLCPHAVIPGENPYCAEDAIVARTTHRNGVTVGGDCHGGALEGTVDVGDAARADEFRLVHELG